MKKGMLILMIIHMEFKKQIIFFVLIGILSVVIDFISYSTLNFLLSDINLSKKIGFIFGAFFSYYANRAITFNLKTKNTIHMLLKYWIIVFIVMHLNSYVNQFLFNYFKSHINYRYLIAFIWATGLSAVANFLLFKYLVFRR